MDQETAELCKQQAVDAQLSALWMVHNPSKTITLALKHGVGLREWLMKDQIRERIYTWLKTPGAVNRLFEHMLNIGTPPPTTEVFAHLAESYEAVGCCCGKDKALFFLPDGTVKFVWFDASTAIETELVTPDYVLRVLMEAVAESTEDSGPYQMLMWLAQRAATHDRFIAGELYEQSVAIDKRTGMPIVADLVAIIQEDGSVFLYKKEPFQAHKVFVSLKEQQHGVGSWEDRLHTAESWYDYSHQPVTRTIVLILEKKDCSSIKFSESDLVRVL